MKMEDGNADIVPLAVLETLAQIGEITPAEAKSLQSFKDIVSYNHKKEAVGKTAADFALEKEEQL